MGGRLDATNAVIPVVSVITPIDYDHQKWLGNTLQEIAAEKAGIIKPRVPVVSATQPPEAAVVITRKRSSLRGRRSNCLRSVRRQHRLVGGTRQRQNAAVTLAALRAGNVRMMIVRSPKGWRTCDWPARFQRWDDRIIIDGAHNPSGARMLARTWRETFGNEKAALVFGVLQDKNAGAITSHLAQISASVVLTRFRGERVMPPAELAAIIAAMTPEIPTAIAESPAEALHRARRVPTAS